MDASRFWQIASLLKLIGKYRRYYVDSNDVTGYEDAWHATQVV